MRSFRTAALAGGVTAGLVFSSLMVPAAAFAAPSGAFSSVEFSKVADGYSLEHNPVDDSDSNNTVAVRDYLGFRIQANTTAAVADATVTLTKPSCWVWESTVDQNLNFQLDNGQTSGAVTHSDDNTIVVTWSQAANGTVLTQPFRAKAGEGCADGSTWAPELRYVDASGSHTQTLEPVTVRSTVGADLSIEAVGAPQQDPNRWFGGGSGDWGATGGAGPALVQRWDISLRPETMAKTGYADPAGTITFTVAYTGPASAFELPRAGGGGPNVQGSGCWVYVSPSVSNNNQFYPSTAAQTVTITMAKHAACDAMLADNGNKLVIYSFTPQKLLEDGYGCSATLQARVHATDGWRDQHGRLITDADPANNTASVPLVCKTVVYDSNWGSAYFAPKVSGAAPADAYPEHNTGRPIVAADARDKWSMLASGTGNGAGVIGAGGTFVSEAGLSPSAPKLTDLTSFHLWDPAVQQLDIAHLDAAVLGAMRPGAAAPASRELDPKSYTRACTSDYNGTNSADLAALSWVDCTSLSPQEISGLRFFRAGVFNGENFNHDFRASKLMFSQVPMTVVGKVGDPLPTRTIWQAKELAHSTSHDVTADIVGNVLRISKKAEDSQVMPEGTIRYTLNPVVMMPGGTFLRGEVTNLRVVDELDIGVQSVDLSGVDPFWRVSLEPADFGPDGVPYTADDVHGIVLTFTPAGSVHNDDQLARIEYVAQMGILLPPQAAPYTATVRNTASIAADGMDPEVAPSVLPKRHSASESVLAATPEAAFFSKELLSDPLIEVEDLAAAWRVQWVNYNNYDLGQGTFVDVFPYDGDARGSKFSGTLKLAALDRVGSALQEGTQVQLTAAAPATIGRTPADQVAWQTVDPTDPATWPQHPTGVRVIVPNVAASTQGYGAIDLRFDTAGQRQHNVYANESSGLVYDPVQERAIGLGVRGAEPVRVTASSLSGLAWVDANADGVRQPNETLLSNVPVQLYRDGDTTAPFRTTTTDANGAYRFTQLHSAEYQVVFDVAQLKTMGYRLTEPNAGEDPKVDSDAHVHSGAVPQLALNRTTTVQHLDIGLIATGLQAGLHANASLTRSYGWEVAKHVLNEAAVEIDSATGEAQIAYEVAVTEGTTHDTNAQLRGEVTVKNPSEAKTFTFTAAVVADDPELVCAVPTGKQRSIRPQQTLVLPFSCAGFPSSGLTPHLIATVTAQDIDPLTGQTIEPTITEIDVEYLLTEVNRSINVNDAAVIGGVQQAVTGVGAYTWHAAGTTHTAQYSSVVEVPAGECLAVQNTAKIEQTGQQSVASMQLCRPVDLELSKHVLTGMERSYGWDITKRLTNPVVRLDGNGEATLDYEVLVTEGSATDAAWSMSGEVTVSNPNTYKAVAATLADTTDIGGGAACAFVAGASVTLGAGEKRVLAYTCRFASEPAYQGSNTATLSWAHDLPGADPALVGSKTVTATAEVRESDWSLTEFQKTVRMTDTVRMAGRAGATQEFGPYTWNAAGTTHREQYSVAVQVPAGECLAVSNTAALVEPGAQAVTEHLLCHEAPLGIADATTASLVRSYEWSIDKQLTNRDNLVSGGGAERVRADYSVVVTAGGVTDTAHQMTGQLTLTNPNAFRAFVVDLADSIDIAGVTCVLERATNIVVPTRGSALVNYRCEGEPVGQLTGAHTVRVTGHEYAGLSHEQAVAYQPVEVNRTVTITDDRHTFDPEWQISWTARGVTHQREYSLAVHTDAGSCQTFVNTARIGADGPASSASVELCAPTTGAARGWLSPTGASLGFLPWLAALLLMVGVGSLAIRHRRSRS